MSSTYSSHGLSNGSSHSNGLARIGAIASTVAGASLTGGRGDLHESDSLSLGGVEGGGHIVGSILSRLSGLGTRSTLYSG